MILDQLNELWNSLITFTEQFVIPAWEELVDLLPVFLLIGVVGPILTLLVIFWIRYLDPQAAREGGLRGPAPPGGARRRRRPGLPGRRAVLALGADDLRAGGHPLRHPARRSSSSCPKCGLVRTADDRHLRQLRAVVHDHATHPHHPARRTAAGRSGRRLAPDPRRHTRRRRHPGPPEPAGGPPASRDTTWNRHPRCSSSSG